MSLLLVPASKENLEMSIEKSVDINFARKYLPGKFLEEILELAGNEGIRCFAVTVKRKEHVFTKLKQYDEVLFSEKRSGFFTHYGIVIGKIHSLEFGTKLWEVTGDNPWEYIYFLANITRVKIPKEIMIELGFSPKFNLPGQIVVGEEEYLKFGKVSGRYNIPVFFDKNKDAEKKKEKNHCCICGITEPEFLDTVFLSYWYEVPEKILDPANGLCFCCLHHKAFNYGYIGFDDDFRILVNSNLNTDSELYKHLSEFSGQNIRVDINKRPSIDLIRLHRKRHELTDH